MADLLKREEVEINGKTFIISSFPSVEGREIIAKYPLSSVPKLGEYAVNEETMFKLMSYVAVPTVNGEQRLTTRAIINNHVPDWETLVKIEWAMLGKNCSFFQDGRISAILHDAAQKLPQWITKILTDSLERLLVKEKPPSMN